MGTNVPTDKISVVCACGAKLNAPCSMLGKRAKCPKCAAPILIAEHGPATTEPVPAQTAIAPQVATQPTQPAIVAVVAAPVPQSAVSPLPVHRRGLEHVGPEYRIDWRLWLTIAKANYRAIAFPAAGFIALFMPCFLFTMFALAMPFALMLERGVNDAEKLIGVFLLPIGVLPSLFFLPPLATGIHLVCQRQLLGKPWSFSTFFAGFRWTWSLGICAMLIALLYFAPTIISQGLLIAGRVFQPAQPIPWLTGLASAINIGLGFVASYLVFRFAAFAHYLVIDRDCGPLDALRGSWRLTQGHFWSLLAIVLVLVFSSSVLSVVTLGIGLAVAAPFGVLFLNAGYLLIAGSEPLPGYAFDSQQRKPASTGVTWLAPAAVATISVLAALLGGFLAYGSSAREVAAFERAMQRKMEEGRKYQERRAKEEAEARAAADKIVTYFRQGGWWSFQVVSEFNAGPSAGPVAPSPAVMAGVAAGDDSAPWNQLAVLVIGPPQLLEQVPVVQLGVHGSLPPEQSAPDLALLTNIDSVSRRLIVIDKVAEAIERQEAVAVIVQMKRPQRTTSITGPGAAGASIGGPGSLPGGPGEATAADPAEELKGLEISLKSAQPLTSEQFRARIQFAQ